MEYNNAQRLVSDISGYDPKETSARDDGYYDQKTQLAKYLYLTDYVKHVADYEIDPLDQTKAFDFLEMEFKNENERFHEFMAL